MTVTNNLAILDPQRRDGPIPPRQIKHSIGEEEKREVREVLASGLLSGFVGGVGDDFFGGPKVRQWEDDLCQYFGSAYAVTFNSATSALHAAVAAAGVHAADEVITSPYSMTASATCIVMQGGVPIFADVDPVTFNIDPGQVAGKVNTRTRAVIPVHLYGRPADLEEIIASAPSAVIIEDSAQAVGARYRDRYAGTVGHIGVLSFNRHKVVQCGEGGVALTDDADLAMRLQLVRNHGEAVVLGLESSERFHDVVGYNYRPTELQAAVALCQLRKLDDLNRHRQEIAAFLDEHLAPFDFLEGPPAADDRSHVYFFYPMRYNARALGLSRETVARAIRAEGLDCREGHYRPIYLHPLFQERPATFHGVNCPAYEGSIDYSAGICPVAERLFFEEVLLTKIVEYPTPMSEAVRFVEVIDAIAHSVSDLKRLENS